MNFFRHFILRLIGLELSRLDAIDAKIDRLLIQGANMAATLDDIVTAVQAEATVEASAVVLLQQLTAALQAAINANDPVKVQSILDQINANNAALSAALVANTPAAPTPPTS